MALAQLDGYKLDSTNHNKTKKDINQMWNAQFSRCAAYVARLLFPV